MNQTKLKGLLQSLVDGEIDVEEAMDRLKTLPYEDLGFAKIDTHRAIRSNFPEVIYCPGKTPVEIIQIMERLHREGQVVLATRAGVEVWQEVARLFPEAEYNERARLIYMQGETGHVEGQVAVVTAGTADLPVAEEAAVCLEVMGVRVNRIYDVGVAGIHRVLERIKDFDEARVIIVVAGMDGALASVVGGLTRRPVIAVPTSVGYGASFSGLAALLTMLNTCAAGVGVVNIDNGYGAAALAYSILNAVSP